MIDQIIETFLRAGNVIYFIFLTSVYAWFLILRKYFLIRNESRRSSDLFRKVFSYLSRKDTSKLKQYLQTEDKIITECIDSVSDLKDKNNVESAIEQNRLYYFSLLDNNVGTINTLAAIAPLLGLLGTVTGMMKTFAIIRLFGSANPALMAEGISEALLTTQAGLIVAFPIVLANTFLKNRIRDLKDNFEKIFMKMRGNHV
ncbi:MAG: MotA/TolQ/ExbB proton channel family protein [Spirochaetes bacterium]|nr:MotA/TolQ/ExbB proton channel family protein [Spirochaetota bacterium]